MVFKGERKGKSVVAIRKAGLMKIATNDGGS